MQENNRDFSTIKARILQYLDKKGITKYECYKNTGIANGVLSQKNGLSEENILKFIAYYEDISLNWLFAGKGEMIRSIPYTETVFSSFAGEKEVRYGKKRDNKLADLSLHEEMICCGDAEKEVLLQSIRKMTETAERNSISLSKMVETVDNNTKILEKLIDYLILKDPDSTTTPDFIGFEKRNAKGE